MTYVNGLDLDIESLVALRNEVKKDEYLSKAVGSIHRANHANVNGFMINGYIGNAKDSFLEVISKLFGENIKERISFYSESWIDLIKEEFRIANETIAHKEKKSEQVIDNTLNFY